MAQIPCLIAMLRKPFYQLVPIFPTGIDLSWIPDGAQPVAQAISGAIDGVNKVFHTSSTNPTVFRNGQLQTVNIDYTNAAGTITFVTAPLVGDVLLELVGLVTQSSAVITRFVAPQQSPDGVRTAFDFIVAPSSIVYNGVIRLPGDTPGYTVVGLTVTFPAAPAVGDQIYGIY